jgi:Family of unknown function (DUF6632)
MELKKRKRRYLQISLVLIGSVFLLLYPLMQLWPSGWVWLPRQHEYEQMMIGVRYGHFGYEGTIANYFIYQLAILNIFKPQKYRLLQLIGTFECLQKVVISSIPVSGAELPISAIYQSF